MAVESHRLQAEEPAPHQRTEPFAGAPAERVVEWIVRLRRMGRREPFERPASQARQASGRGVTCWARLPR